MKQTSLHLYLVALLASVFLLFPGVSSAQQENEDSVHWAYASFLGTGWYELDDNQQVYVLRIPLRWYFQDSSYDESGNRQLGIEFPFPLTYGLHKLEQFEDFVDVDNIGTVSFNPGVEIEYPVSDRWLLRAYGHIGWGKSVDADDEAWIYDGGLKSKYSFRKEKLDWAIVNEISFAGYNSEKSGSDGLTGIMGGLSFSYPLPSRANDKTAFKLDWDISYRWYENNPSFPRFVEDNSSSRLAGIPVDIEDEWQIAVAIAKQSGPFKIWFMDFQHFGLTYRFNSDGTFQAITFNFRSIFTR